MYGNSWKSIESASDFRKSKPKPKVKEVPKKEVLYYVRNYLKGKVGNEDVNQITPSRMAMMLTTRMPKSDAGAIKVLTTWYRRQMNKSPSQGKNHK